MKTIFMPEETMKKWLTALRSGEYKQGTGALEVSTKGDSHYCCLGVLQHMLDGAVEYDEYGNGPLGVPSQKWCKNNFVRFCDENGRVDNSPCPVPVLNIRISPNSGDYHTAASANDSGYTFSRIADALEEVYGGPMENMTKEAP